MRAGLEYQPIEALDASVEASIAHALAQGEERDPPSVSVALAHLQELTPNALVYAMLETLGKAPLLSTDTLMELCTCSCKYLVTPRYCCCQACEDLTIRLSAGPQMTRIVPSTKLSMPLSPTICRCSSRS